MAQLVITSASTTGERTYTDLTGLGGAQRFDQSSAGTWIIAHGFGRSPAVQVFTTAGELVQTDVTVDATNITATFAQPMAGFVLAS